MQEAYTDDTHTPLEVLRPRFDNRGHMDGHHAKQGLRLHEAEQRQGIGRHVSGGVGVSKTGCNGRRSETQSRDDGGRPANTFLVNRLPVGQACLEARDTLTRFGGVDIDTDIGVEVGNGVCDACAC